jgi:hypothetical protein
MHQDHSATDDLGDLEKVRSEALHKVGRNVVNFAKIEGAQDMFADASRIFIPDSNVFLRSWMRFTFHCESLSQLGIN